jgi:predicted RNase H-like nuclease (RuvC/YqgF family)
MDLKSSLASLHGRLNSMQDEFQRDLSSLIGELESALSAADQLGSIAADQDQRVRRLEARADGQNSVIETLSQEAVESHGLRRTVRERDLEIARLTRELDTKNDLINALRRQLEAKRKAYAGSEAEAV